MLINISEDTLNTGLFKKGFITLLLSDSCLFGQILYDCRVPDIIYLSRLDHGCDGLSGSC